MSVPTHLTAERWAALRLARDESLVAHLAEGCDTCDAFLATLPGLDGHVDRHLLALKPRGDADELSWQRFRRRSARRTIPLLVAAAVALLSISGAVAVNGPWAGLKGGDGPAVIALSAAAREGDGALHAVETGASVSERATLVFRVDSTVRGRGFLLVQRAGQEPEVVEPVELDGGMQELTRERGFLGFSLHGERGAVVVYVVASEDELTPAEARAAIRHGGGSRVAVSRIEVTVTP